MSNALIEIDNGSFEYLKNVLTEKKLITESNVDKDLYEILLDKRFIVENDWDEFNEYKKCIISNRNANGGLNLTIAPTMDCNYSCPYCFEEKEDVYISDLTIQSITNFVKNQTSISNIYIQWFGGEPLLAINEIRKLYDKLKAIEGKKISSGMITNGYLLNEVNVNILKEIGVNQLQITLDGLKDTHNKTKYTKDCTDTFSVTISNIDLLSQIAPDMNINIRINIDKNNASEYVIIHKFLKERYSQNPNININPGIVQDFKDQTLCPSSDSNLFSRKDIMEFAVEMYDKHQLKTPFVQYPNNYIRECGIRNENALIFDPEGYVYKCWEIIGNKNYAVGKLAPEGVIVDVNHKLLNRYLYGADPIDDKKCQECSYLPICSGGCPHHRIENRFNGKKMDTCTYLKGNLPELIRIHLDSKRL